MLSVDWLSIAPFSFDVEATEAWLNVVASEEGRSLDEIALIFCTDDELLDLNVKHLQHDYYTDIITFDYSEEVSIVGDLFISVDRVRDNAKTLNVDFDVELDRVIVHGVLHLCGYGDKGEHESAEMRKKEDFYLNKR